MLRRPLLRPAAEPQPAEPLPLELDDELLDEELELLEDEEELLELPETLPKLM
jgi:hypothetical protein